MSLHPDDICRDILNDVINDITVEWGFIISENASSDYIDLSAILNGPHKELSRQIETTTSPAQTDHFMQLRVLQQRSKDVACGYRALHSALCIMSSLKCKTLDCAWKYLLQTQSSASYWHFIRRVETLLREKAEEVGGGYLWETTDWQQDWAKMDLGFVLERPHCSHLLKNMPDVARIGADFSIFDYSLLDGEKLHSLGCIFSKFQDQRCYVHCFLVGAVDHWVLLVIMKGSDGQFQRVYADSKNFPLPPRGLSDNELEQYVTEHEEGSGPRHSSPLGKASTRFGRLFFDKRARRLERCKSIVKTCDILWRCARGEVDIRGVYLSNLLESLMNGYERVVRNGESHAEADASERLLLWLTEYSPPAMVRKLHLRNIQRVGAQFIPRETAERLHMWCTSMVAWLDDPSRSKLGAGEAVLHRFRTDVIDELKRLLPSRVLCSGG